MGTALNPPIVFPIVDNYNRPDSQPLITLGSPEITATGDIWHPFGVVYGILNKAASFIEGSSFIFFAYTDSGVSDGEVQVEGPGLNFRFVDSNNLWAVNVYSDLGFAHALVKYVAGVRNVVATWFPTTNHIKVVFNGSSISVFDDENLVATTVDAFIQTATRVGLFGTMDTSANFGIPWKNFYVADTTSPIPVTKISDTFNRVDNPTLGVTTSSGSPYIYDETGIWWIRGQQGEAVEMGGLGSSVFIATGQSDVDYSLRFTHAGEANMNYRYNNTKNDVTTAGFFVNNQATVLAVFGVAGGVGFLLGVIGPNLNDGDTIKISLRGAQHSIFVNGTLIYSAANGGGGTFYGFFGSPVSDSFFSQSDFRFNNLSINIPINFSNIVTTSITRDRAVIEWDTDVATINNQVFYSLNDLSFGLSNTDFMNHPFHHKVTIVFPSNAQPGDIINFKVRSFLASAQAATEVIG